MGEECLFRCSLNAGIQHLSLGQARNQNLQGTCMSEHNSEVHFQPNNGSGLNFGQLYNARAHDWHNRQGDKLYPLDGPSKRPNRNTQNGVILAQNSIQIREFKNIVDPNNPGKVLKNSYELRQPYVVDFITKAVPQYDCNPYRAWITGGITVNRDGTISPADQQKLHDYYRTSNRRGFWDHWQNNEATAYERI